MALEIWRHTQKLDKITGRQRLVHLELLHYFFTLLQKSFAFMQPWVYLCRRVKKQQQSKNMYPAPVYIPTGYTPTSTWSHSQAAPQHGATYASRIYKTVGHHLGRSQEHWLECLSYGMQLHWMLRQAPWGTNERGDRTDWSGPCTYRTVWQREGDFILAQFAWATVTVDLTTGQIVTVYFRGSSHHVCDPQDEIAERSKGRQIEAGTWQQHGAPAAPKVERTKRKAWVWPYGYAY